MTFATIKHNFDRGLWNEKMVKVALDKGVITQEEYDEIVGQKED